MCSTCLGPQRQRWIGLEAEPAATGLQAAGASRYLGLFVQEATEQLEAFDLEVGRLEGDAPLRPDFSELLRLTHSIKGAAGAMGYRAITELAHQLEELLVRLPQVGGTSSKETIDLLHRAGSGLGEMVAAAAGGEQPRSAPALMNELARVALDTSGGRAETSAGFGFGLERGPDSLQRRAQLHAERLSPVATLSEWLQTLVRAVASSLGKEVSLELSGAGLDVDRSVIDRLVDPLGHILRNCVHHGIEPAAERAAAGKPPIGQLRLSALRSGERMTIVVEDDGRGMDPERLRSRAAELGLVPAELLATLSPQQALLLCCLPGLSTASEITEVSGRGVGMDRVAHSVERLGGTLTIHAAQGVGTRFILDLPLPPA